MLLLLLLVLLLSLLLLLPSLLFVRPTYFFSFGSVKKGCGRQAKIPRKSIRTYEDEFTSVKQ